MLKQGWPYYEKDITFKRPSNITQEIARKLTLKEIGWDKAMEKLFQYYEQKAQRKKP